MCVCVCVCVCVFDCFCIFRIVTPIASSVCPLMDEVSPKACEGLLVVCTDAYSLVDETGVVPLMGRPQSVGVFRGVCELSMALAPCLLVSRSVFLSCWLFGLRHFSTGACSFLGGARSSSLDAKMVTSRRAHAEQYSVGPLPPVFLPAW